MGALTIAFDTVIVGALALPWVILVIHLFFFEGENRVLEVLEWVRKSQMTAVAGVLLFTMAYTLGSVVSRLAEDFFNDDDLYVQTGRGMIRWGTTEDRIIASVYCQGQDNELLPETDSVRAIAGKVGTFIQQRSAVPGADEAAAGDDSTDLCDRVLRWHGSFFHNEQEDDLVGTARDIFGLEENKLLLKGEDATLRLRQFHDQIMVLRGAAFNGVVAVAFCIFAWCARWRRAHPDTPWRWLLLAVPLVPVALSLQAARHHFSERVASDPPYMEFSLIAIGIAGLILLWPLRRPPRIQKEATVHLNWLALSVLSLGLTFTVTLGWWATEVIYAQQVIYTYDAQSTAAQRVAAKK